MGLISRISRFGKEDCIAPCQPIEQCEFDCRSCLDFAFQVRVTLQGITNGTGGIPAGQCNQCAQLNVVHPLSSCTGPLIDCTFLVGMIATNGGACPGTGFIQIGGGPNLVRVTLGQTGLFQIVWEIVGLDGIEQLCGGGSLLLPFARQTGFLPTVCTGAGSTALIELVPGNCGGPCTSPTVNFTLTPGDPTPDDTPTFEWATTGTVSITTLTLDDGEPIEMITGQTSYTFGHLEPGPHTVVIEVDSNGCGTATDSYSWTQVPIPNCVAPTVTFTQTPPATTTDTSATFQWTTTGTVTLTLLRLDGGPPIAPISSNIHTYQFLAPGTHTVEIEVDSQQCGEDFESYTWTITGGQPCVPPTVTLTQTPPNPTQQTSATFAWTTTGTVAQTFVRIDSGPQMNPSGNNTHTINNLTPGPHTFEVEVQSGDCGNASASYNWQINAPCTPPTVNFTQTPPASTTSTSATFAWSSTGSVAATTIRIDNGPWLTPSGNTHTFTNLSQGTHTVDVLVDSQQCGTDTESYTWQITGTATLCEKVNNLFQLLGTSNPNVDVEITFAGVFANNCGVTNYNRTYLIPGPNVLVNNCPEVTICELIEDHEACGTVIGTYNDNAWILCPTPDTFDVKVPTLAWLLCTGCTTPEITTPPMIRVRSSFPSTSNGAAQFADFAASGTSQVESLVDQMLATGQCQIPFFQQLPANPGPTTPFPRRDFRFATCTIRVL